MGMFGIPTEFALRDGKVVFNPVRPEAKQYLAYMAQLYKDGMIPKDFSMLNGQSLQEMFTGNQIGLFVLDYPWPSKTIIPTMTDAGADVKFMDFPTGATGEPSYSRAYFPVGPSAAIAKGTKDVKSHIEFIEFLLKPETQEITNYGLEGEHFTRDGDDIVPTEEGLKIAWSVYFKQLATPEEWYNMYGVMAEWAEYYYPVERNSAKNDVDPVFFLPPQPELVAKKTDLATKVDTFYTEVVMGQRSVDEFDAFAKDWLNSGGQDILDGYNELYQSLGSPTFKYNEYPVGDKYTGANLFNGKR
jgi:putative aldouronate transport system substrate-binding protein